MNILNWSIDLNALGKTNATSCIALPSETIIFSDVPRLFKICKSLEVKIDISVRVQVVRQSL